MTATSWWMTGAATVGGAATVMAAALIWLVLTRPVALVQVLALGQ